MAKNHTNNTITWKIARRENKDSRLIFHIVLLAIFVLLLLFSLHQKDILFGIFIIISAGTILFISTEKPEMDLFIIDKNGISINKHTEYDYDDIKHFNIYKYSDEYYVLLLEFKAKLKPILQIRIYEKDRDKIENKLSKDISKKKIEPSIIDIFQKIIGM